MKANDEIFWAKTIEEKVALQANTLHYAKREVYSMRHDVVITLAGKVVAKRVKGVWQRLNLN